MSAPNHRQFLSECLVPVPAKQPGLSDDELYGLYLSWCLLNARKPGPTASLWAAVRQEGYLQRDRGGRNEWPDLCMTGPAAVDYILASRPSLL